MKRILVLFALCGAALLLLATPGPDHKILWCHFPPGQWTGTPATSKVLVLEIDVAADGSLVDVQHLNHTGDGPVGGTNNLGQALGPDCHGVTGCGAANYSTGSGASLVWHQVNLVGTAGNCVCPAGTPLDGLAPVTDPNSPGGLPSCGAAG